jgi:serine/threonine protein kinase
VTTTKGQHLIGKVVGMCVLEKTLGYGGSSAVFLAQQNSPRRKVAVKVFLPSPHMNIYMQREFYRRFLHEAEAASKLNHAHILPIYAYGEQDGMPYIVMPYMAGGTLSGYMSKRDPLSLEEACWYLDQIAEALDYAHTEGYIHCDVKPSNILLDDDGYAMLSDFGIARLLQLQDEATEAVLPMVRDAVIGTPDYISPEQALGNPLDGRSDIYSLGIMLFYLLTKRLPFKADSPIALALQHVHEPPPPPSSLRADLTPAVDRVVLRALAKKPAARYQTARQFSKAFAESIKMAGEAEPFASKLIQKTHSGNDLLGAGIRLWARSGKLTRLIAATAAILLLISGYLITANVIAPSVGQMPAHTQHNTAASSQERTVDRLANPNDWPISSTFFYAGQQYQYHILNESARGVALALYEGQQFDNFRLSVTMTQIRVAQADRDYYGIVFRCAPDQSHYYLFEIVPSGQYDFMRYNGYWTDLVNGWTPELTIGKSNTITIEANGNAFIFGVNGKVVGAPVKDTSAALLGAGQVGLYVENQGVEIAFSHLYIETL